MVGSEMQTSTYIGRIQKNQYILIHLPIHKRKYAGTVADFKILNFFIFEKCFSNFDYI